MKKIIVLLVTLAMAFSGYQVTAAAGKTVYYFKAYDLTGYQDPETGLPSKLLGMSDYVALKVVQGVVNRTDATLLIDQNLNYYTDSDIHWKVYYESKGYTFITLNSIADVYQTFKSRFSGIVTYNHTMTTDLYHWPELDMAAVVGSLTDRIPVLSSQVSRFQTDYGLAPAATLTLTDSFSDYPDAPGTISGRLETYGWTTPLQAYQWGYDHLLKYCNPHEFHHMAEESFDLAAERKMFYAYLLSGDPAQFNLLKNIYSYYDSRNASFPVWGWVQHEDVDLNAMAPYGGYIKMAGSTNLSFHNKAAASSNVFAHQSNYTVANTTVQQDKYYITFTASENDTPKAVTTFQHGAWLDANRGNVPINWGFEASMAEEAPALAEYYYSHATSNDYFFSGGATPLGFADYDEMPADVKNEIKLRGAALMQKVDQRFLDLYSGYGAIGPLSPVEYGDLGAALGVDALIAETPNGEHQVWGNTFVSGRSSMYPLRQTDFSDDFSSGTGKWTTTGGSWAIEGGEFSQSAATASPSLAYAINGLHGYVNADARLSKQASVSGMSGIAFRKGTGDNYYWFYLKDGSKAGLMKVVNGVRTVIGTEVDFTHVKDTFYTLRVVASGSSIKGYINDKLVLDRTDGTFATGRLGLATLSSHTHFDDVKAVFTTQAQQIINDIKSRTVDIARAKPAFLSGYYGYMFTGEHEKNQYGHEPGAGQVMAVNPTILKEVQDTLNASYPGQYKFARLDEMVSAQRLYADSLNTDMTDELNDYSKMYSHSANLLLDANNQAAFNGDASRLARSSNTEEYIIYKTPSQTRDITGFTAAGWYWPDEAVTDFAFYASPDGVTYTPFTPAKTTVNGTGSIWNKMVYKGASLPGGTKFIKMVFKQNTANYWNPQLGSVGISTAPATGTVIDNFNDWTKVYSHSANLAVDTSNPAAFNGDAARLVRSANTEEHVVYKIPSASQRMTRFSAEAWFWLDETITDFAFYVSPDNINYTAIMPTKTLTSAVGIVWNKVGYKANSLPSGTQYLKIVFKHSTSNYWNPQIGKVEYAFQ
ncbi:hypothetical protein GCM10010911_40950 [Paenibacillus nasutitermitis]|uniref:GxGYxYP putative glycoside hydrolase C-terminal domain-containing protein n=2 Tax=Paenibacillus nasutitermitis TaxID=1652958 RepID=A0A917DWQ1_9BACL|nr:hypothetical protein GCM10010911_40950 [Paenibacillus nasutitermitis]